MMSRLSDVLNIRRVPLDKSGRRCQAQKYPLRCVIIAFIVREVEDQGL